MPGDGDMTGGIDRHGADEVLARPTDRPEPDEAPVAAVHRQDEPVEAPFTGSPLERWPRIEVDRSLEVPDDVDVRPLDHDGTGVILPGAPEAKNPHQVPSRTVLGHEAVRGALGRDDLGR